MTVLLIVAASLNILLVIWKLRNNRVLDGFVDGAILISFGYVFSAATMLPIGIVASLIVSLYLLTFPIRFKGV
jgi:hypothetical protein